MKTLKSKKGFTMVEIIIVLVIIAILIGAAVPAMIGFVNEARGKGMSAEANACRTAFQSAMSEYMAMNPDDDPEDFDLATMGAYTLGAGISIEDKVIEMLDDDFDMDRLQIVEFNAGGRLSLLVLTDSATTGASTRWIALEPGSAAQTGRGETWPSAPTPDP